MTTTTPDRHHEYQCRGCENTRPLRRKGARVRAPCPDCELVTCFERVGRVDA